MQKIYFLLIVLLSLTFVPKAEADHVIGGEIRWQCLPSGEYQFFMTVYRDCTFIPFTFQDEDLEIIGSPLPKNESNQSFSSILLTPDSALWQSRRNGDLSPRCAESGNEYSCPNEDQGTVQAFYYKSDSITMDGVPPPTGWNFFWTSPCCRTGNIRNLNTNGTMLLKATMYPTKNGDNVNPCIDSSPEFSSLPTTFVCRGQEFTYYATAKDSDLDSMVYSWDRPYNPPIGNPEPLDYKAGFNFDNPTPDQTFDARNIPSTLNPISGTVELAVYSGLGYERFINVYRVDSYRDGVKISSVFREILFFVFNCPRIDSVTPNNQPEFYFDNAKQKEYEIVVEAGEKVEFPVQVYDQDIPTPPSLLQEVTLFPSGNQFSADFMDTTNCANPPCAVLNNSTPQFDSSRMRYELSGQSAVGTDFEWQTNCGHLNADGAPKTYYFYFSAKDDHCPVPGRENSTISVKVQETPLLSEPIMKGASVGLDGSVTYQWTPPIDSFLNFYSYNVQSATTINGNAPSYLGSLNPDLRVYLQEQRIGDLGIYRPIGGIPANGPDLMNKVPSRDWYLRMRTFTSVCNDSIAPSTYAESVRVMELELSPDQERETVLLNWNRPKPMNAKTYSYLIYESPTHFYIWQNDSVNNAQLSVESNWTLKSQTTADSLLLSADACGNNTAYRVEARDTVITYKQGSGFSDPEYDTLTFSTFSTIDTVYLEFSKPSIYIVSDSVLTVDFTADSYQWYDCHADTIITSENGNTFSPKDSGSYALIVSKLNCKDTSDCFQYFSVGLEEVEFQNELTYYPNPTNGELFVEFEKLQSKLQVQVFSIHGQLVMEQEYLNRRNLQLELQGKSGIYFIQLTNQSGERANLKVVKQ